jgi:hypothetical protein
LIRYAGRLIFSMWQNLGEAALAGLIAITVAAFYVSAGLTPPVLQLVIAVVLFEIGMASWRCIARSQWFANWSKSPR